LFKLKIREKENIYILMPASYAAKTFSFIPPTGRTIPVNVISPVIAISFRTFLFTNNDTNDVTIVIPAEGPSF
jgi:hypothetical protein